MQRYKSGKFTDQEARKSAGTILVTHEAMVRKTENDRGK
ncbi:helix-turn-helix domain-containing protein [Bacillus pseudomycoides]|nr:helix-turn-helix domain-containing protein [Bacillus pseudomycoides]MED0855812.1 helix-turn-helix domain-containing protein [Bacillus pseudomycoides]